MVLHVFPVSPVLYSVHIFNCLAFLLFLPNLALLYRSVCTMTCFKYDISGLTAEAKCPQKCHF